jgi:hypothetical protein
MSKKYICDKCNFKSNNKTDYVRHSNSMKHYFNTRQPSDEYGESNESNEVNEVNETKSDSDIDANGDIDTDDTNTNTIEKDENSYEKKHDIYICPYCKDKFSRKNNMKIHKWSCSEKIIKEKNKMIHKTLNKKNKLLQKVNLIHQNELKAKDDLLSKYKEDVNYFKQLLLVSGSNEKENKSINSYKYINNTFRETIPLQKLTYKKFSSINKIQFIDNKNPTKELFIYDILHAYKHGIIHKYIGKVIVEIYKDCDPSKQSLWIADKSRLKYIIREQNEDNLPQWIVDSNGIKTSELIIDPLLDDIKKSLIAFNKKQYEQINNNKYSYNEQRTIIEDQTIIETILNEIQDGKLRTKILKYISNFFCVDLPINQ